MTECRNEKMQTMGNGFKPLYHQHYLHDNPCRPSSSAVWKFHLEAKTRHATGLAELEWTSETNIFGIWTALASSWRPMNLMKWVDTRRAHQVLSMGLTLHCCLNLGFREQRYLQILWHVLKLKSENHSKRNLVYFVHAVQPYNCFAGSVREGWRHWHEQRAGWVGQGSPFPWRGGLNLHPCSCITFPHIDGGFWKLKTPTRSRGVRHLF